MLSKFSIKKRLFAFVAIMLIGLAAITAITVPVILSLSKQVQVVSEVDIILARNIALLDMMHDGVRGILLKSLVASEKKELETYNGSVQEFNEFKQNFKKYLLVIKSLPLEKKIQDLIGKAESDIVSYVSVAENVLRTAYQQEHALQHPSLPEFNAAFLKLEKNLILLGNTVEKSVSDRAQSSRERTQSVILIISILIPAIALLLIAIGYLIIKSVSEPMQKMAESIQRIASGNLTEKIDTKYSSDESFRDEIIQIFCKLGLFLASFKEKLISLRTISNVVDTSTREILSMSKSTSQSFSQQAAAIKEVVSTMEESNVINKNVSQETDQIVIFTKNTKEEIQKGSQLLENTLNKISQIQKTNLETIEEIKCLSQQISGIWEIINLINTIADQTKIIAFNAELEASSAGEAGKNFQIVATEIRRLADNTVSFTGDIKLKIQDIQKSSDKLVMDVESETKIIAEGCALSQDVRTVFNTIQSSSDKSYNSVNVIVNAIQQQSSGFEQILTAVKDISQNVNQINTQFQSANKTSENLENVVRQLQAIIDQYKTENG